MNYNENFEYNIKKFNSFSNEDFFIFLLNYSFFINKISFAILSFFYLESSVEFKKLKIKKTINRILSQLNISLYEFQLAINELLKLEIISFELNNEMIEFILNQPYSIKELTKKGLITKTNLEKIDEYNLYFNNYLINKMKVKQLNFSKKKINEKNNQIINEFLLNFKFKQNIFKHKNNLELILTFYDLLKFDKDQLFLILNKTIIKDKNDRDNFQMELFLKEISLLDYNKLLSLPTHYFLVLKLNRDLVNDEKIFVTTLDETLHLSNEYLNMIIDYSFIKNNNQFRQNYILKIAKSIYKNINQFSNLEELQNHFSNAYASLFFTNNLKQSKKTQFKNKMLVDSDNEEVNLIFEELEKKIIDKKVK